MHKRGWESNTHSQAGAWEREGGVTMKKFDEWNEVKKVTSLNKRKLGIKPREIFWVKIGHNIGSEEYGKDRDFVRPVIIIKRLTSDLFIGIPLTSRLKNNDYFHQFTYHNKTHGVVENSAMILQFRTYSIKRVLSKIGKIDVENFEQIVEKSRRLFNPTWKSGCAVRRIMRIL